MSFYNYKVMPHNVANNHRVTRGLPSGGIKYAAPISDTSYNDFSEYLLNKYSSGNNKGLTTNIGEVTTTPEIFADYLKEKYPTGQNAVYTRTESKNTGVGGAPSSQSGTGAGIVGLGVKAMTEAVGNSNNAEVQGYSLGVKGGTYTDAEMMAKFKTPEEQTAFKKAYLRGLDEYTGVAKPEQPNENSKSSPQLGTGAGIVGLGVKAMTEAVKNSGAAKPEQPNENSDTFGKYMLSKYGGAKVGGSFGEYLRTSSKELNSENAEYTEKEPKNTDAGNTESTSTDGNSAGSGVVIEPSVTAPVSSGSGISFEQYLRNYGGVDTERQFAESVRQANSDFYRALMTYGKKAEALAGNGLVGGGMSDYGGAAAYAARQGAVAGAGEIKAQTDAFQIKSFSDYLQGTAGGSALDKHKAAATQIYEQARVNGSSHDAALIAVKNAGYTDSTVLSGLEGNYKEAQGANIGFTIGQYLSDKTYSVMGENYVSKDTLDQAVASGMIDKDGDVYNEQLGRIQEANAANLDKLIKGVHDEGEKGFNLEKACAEFGVEYNEESKEELAEQMLPVLRERAQELYYAGDISEAQYHGFVETYYKYECDAAFDEKNALWTLCGSLAEAKEALAVSESGDEALAVLYEDVINDLIFRIQNTNPTGNTIKPTLFIHKDGKQITGEVKFEIGKPIKVDSVAVKGRVESKTGETLVVLEDGTMGIPRQIDGTENIYPITDVNGKNYDNEMKKALLELLSRMATRKQ